MRIGEALLQECTPDAGLGCYTCPLGNTGLQDTGFDSHAASPWLTASAAAQSGTEITLRFAIFDSGDATYDSTVLIDNFQWLEASKLWLPLVVK